VKHYAVVFAPEAQDDLLELYAWIAERTSPAVAQRYTDAIVEQCERLATLPQRGAPREDVRPGLRITHYRGRTVIAYAVDDDAGRVVVLGVFHGGRDYGRALGQPDMDSDDEPN